MLTFSKHSFFVVDEKSTIFYFNFESCFLNKRGSIVRSRLFLFISFFPIDDIDIDIDIDVDVDDDDNDDDDDDDAETSRIIYDNNIYE